MLAALNRLAAGMAAAVVLISCACGDSPPTESVPEVKPAAAAEASYTGRDACAECHAREDELWRGSHHDLAMQVADESTVLGDFDGATHTHFHVTSSFFRRDGGFFVRTDGPDGELADYRIAYTFGADPLQQYLVEFPGGRYQTLALCWDTRPAAEGGQRWFHIYPDEPIPHDDVLHWTGPYQNWNHMCAECHSTDLRKGYRAAEGRFETTWSEIDVSCEACHGPGSRHVAWAREMEKMGKAEGGKLTEVRPAAVGDMDLVVHFKDPQEVHWEVDLETGTARRSVPRTSHIEVEACGRCHSRRSPIHEEYRYGRPLLDTHRVAILDEALYHPDGQILEEVYVYGSFLQSRMYAAGVTCSDCHDPHSGRLYAEGNGLCARCHAPSRFDTPEHHFHKAESTGALCVECHMPVRTYMVVDPRHDHSLRVPRPDLSLKLGSPNACSSCHTDQSIQWNLEAVATWYGPDRRAEPHWGEAIDAGRRAGAGAEEQLIRVLGDPSVPAIARATAVSLLPRYAGPGSGPVFEAALRDESPLVRAAAVAALEAVEPRVRLRLAHRLLDDPVRAVRLEAGRVLASVPEALMDAGQRARLRAALAEYRAAQRMDADRAEAHLRLGTLYMQQQQLAQAESEFERAREIAPHFVPAYVNLADLHRVQGREGDGEAVLRKALEIAPDDGDVRHALGLLLVRRKRLSEAIGELERASTLRPELPRYSYVLAVALHSAGDEERALQVLRDAAARHPADRDIQAFLTQLEQGR
jgi:predicted CXXCH cytochrome family protein